MSEHASESGSLELGRYWAIVRRRWVVVVALTVLGAVLAGAYAYITPKTYTATTLVNLNVIADEPFSTQRSASGLIDPATESQLARSSTVLEAAAADLGSGTTIADVRRSMTVTVLPEATVARVTFSADSLDRAMSGADAVGKAYVDYRTVTAQDKVDRIVKSLTDQQTSISRDLVAVNKVLGQASSDSQRAAAVSQRQVLEAQLDALLTQLSGVASIDTAGGYVITKAEDNSVAVQPHGRLLVGAGLALGLVLGIIAAFVVNALDPRVTRPQLRKAGGGLLLAALADRRQSVPAVPADLDAYRSAAEQLLALRAVGRTSFTIVDLTSADQPSVASNMALGLVSAGDRRVTVVFPSGSTESARRLVEGSDGRRVPSPLPGTGGAAVALGRVGDADDEVPTVLVALPPGAPRSEILSATRHTGSAVVVVEERRTRVDEVRAVADGLAAVGGEVVGSVITPRMRRRRAWTRQRNRVAESDQTRIQTAQDGA